MLVIRYIIPKNDDLVKKEAYFICCKYSNICKNINITSTTYSLHVTPIIDGIHTVKESLKLPIDQQQSSYCFSLSTIYQSFSSKKIMAVQ